MKQLPNLDFIIKKEGEIPFVKLVEQLNADKSNFDEVPSLIYRKDNKISRILI